MMDTAIYDCVCVPPGT